MSIDLKFFQRLTAAFGCSKQEKSVALLVLDELQRQCPGVQTQTDSYGNLWTRIGNPDGPRILVDAHMDTVGIVAGEPIADGFMQIGTIGAVMPEELISRRVVFANGTKGTVCLAQNAYKGEIRITDLYLELDACGMVTPGECAIYEPYFQNKGDSVIASYVDNRASCLALLETVKHLKQSPNDLYILFSTQQEIGSYGAAHAVEKIQPQAAVVLDIGFAGDAPGSVLNPHVHLDGGLINRCLTDSVLSNDGICRSLELAAKHEDIFITRTSGTSNTTNAGSIHRYGQGVPTAILSIPARRIRSSYEKVSIQSIESCTNVLTCLLNSVMISQI